jgi:1,4-dihydroxy-2-naphthoyl-CoA synthase
MTVPAPGGDYTQILFALENGVGRITLNRPERLNSFTETMHAELARALDALEAEPGLRGLVITGASAPARTWVNASCRKTARAATWPKGWRSATGPSSSACAPCPCRWCAS